MFKVLYAMRTETSLFEFSIHALKHVSHTLLNVLSLRSPHMCMRVFSTNTLRVVRFVLNVIITSGENVLVRRARITWF